MTRDSEKDTDKYYTTFDGKDAENTWWEYSMMKPKVIAEKYKWMSAIESNVVNPTTKEQKAGEAAMTRNFGFLKSSVLTKKRKKEEAS
jgi:hypothetical protein